MILCSTGAKNLFKLLLSTSLFAIFVVPLLLVFLIFFIYRTMVFTVLKLKFRSKLGGMLTGWDVLFATDTTSRNIINIIMIATTKNSFEEFSRKFKEVVNERIFKNLQIDPKFLSTRRKSGGYHYFIHNQVDIDECVKSINLNWQNDKISKKELLQEISRYSNQSLPYNNTGFWEFLLCEKPVTWKNRNNKTEKSYAVLLRFHHCLADGASLLNLMYNIFSDAHGKTKIESLPTKNKCLYNFKGKIRDILDSVFMLLITPVVLFSQIFFQNFEISSMNKASLSDQQILVVKVEESKICMKIIKDIKQRVNDTYFVDVLTVAISKSLNKYFQKKGQDPSLTYFNAYLTILMEKLHYLQFTERKFIELRNKFQTANLSIPIIYNAKAPVTYWQSFMETLKKVKIETKYLKASPDYKVMYRVCQVVTYLFPESIVLLLYLTISPNVLLAITNLPAPPAMTLFGGDCLIEDIVMWVPRMEPVGLTLGIISYDERLQIALNVDKAIISNERDAQDIVDGIYQALIELDTRV